MNKPTPEQLNAALDAGKTIMVSTYLRAWQITAKTRDSWRKVGRELFKQDKGGSLYIGSGKRYDCIDYCAIRIF